MSLLLGFAGAQVAGGPTTHQASVAFAGTGAASYTASLLLAATVAFGGTGTVAAQATQNHAASVAFVGTGTLSGTAILSQPAATTFTGTGTFSANGQLLHAASVAFNGAGTFTATPDAGLAAVTHPASVLFGGAGTFTAAGAQVHAASVNFAGVGTFAAQAALTHAASVAFAGAGAFDAVAAQIHTASVAFAGAATFDAGDVLGAEQPIPLPPGIPGYEQTAGNVHQARVGFRSDSHFSARAVAIRGASVTFNAVASVRFGTLTTSKAPLRPVSFRSPPPITYARPSFVQPQALSGAVSFRVRSTFRAAPTLIQGRKGDGTDYDDDLAIIAGLYLMLETA